MANKRLNATITIGGAVAGSLKSALGTTKTKLVEVGDAVKKLHDRQAELNRVIRDQEKLGRAGSALKVQYAQQELRMLDAKIARIRKIQSIESNMKAGGARMASAGMAIGAVAAAASTAFVPVVQAASFEKAMLGVAKQVAGARDESGKLTAVYYQMATQIQQLGREIPIATNELAEMVAAGARMGVAKDELVDFTRTAAMMASAFELPAGELAEQMGKIAGLYKIPIPAIGQLADTINYLDDNAIAKGGDIIEFLQRVGGVAGSVKVTSQQMAALGSTLLTLGEKTETASTATNALFQKLAAADKGTKKFKAAMDELGLSTAEVQKNMQIDAQGTILQVLEAINKLPEEKRLGALVDLVGLEHSDTVAKLAGGIEEYRKQIDLAGSQQAKGSMSREFQAQLATTSAQWEILKNRVTEVGVNIGSVLLPAVNSLMGAIGPMASAVADWVRENGTLAKNLMTIGGIMLGAVVAGKALAFGIGAVTFAFNALRLAIMTNPIGLAVTLLTTAAVLIYQNWAPIKQFFVDLWDGIVGAAKSAWDWMLKNVLLFKPLALIIENWEPIREFFTSLWADITGTAQRSLDWIVAKIESVGRAWQKTKEFFGAGGDEKTVQRTNSAPAIPPVPATATAARAAGSVTDNSQTTINITQQPGQDPRALADEIERRRKAEAAVRARSSLVDGAGRQ